ncbi:hypothetical protein HGM15179_014757 [Zosterops borbonicus]|uniref:Uncharacterized protein n=1 Tax=Zosterops borbonicus TaxID=364589 RepID=A0A8K1G652_9PASS|nr:hypothetical protein HGM15179_014757 [Zosterops borbonicus]
MFWGFMNKCTQFVRGGIGDEAFQPFLSFSLESVTSLLENVQCPLNDMKDTTFLVFHMVSFLYVVCSWSRMRAEISRGAYETADPEVEPEAEAGVENPEWCGEWEDMGQTLKEFSDPSAWEFSREQIHNSDEVGKYLEDNCHDDCKEKKLIAISWALAYAYCTLLDTVGQQTEAGGQGDKSAATAVAQAAANTPVTQTAAKPDSEPKTAAKPDSELKTLSVASVKKRTHKTDRPVDDDLGDGSSMPPNTQSEAQPTDTQSEAKQTDTKSEAQPAGTRLEAQPAGTRSGATIESFSLKDLCA